MGFVVFVVFVFLWFSSGFYYVFLLVLAVLLTQSAFLVC